MPFPGPGARTRVSTSGARVVRFSRDGSQLLYLAPDHGLMAVPVKTSPEISVGTPHELFKVPGRLWSAFEPLPDGRFVALVPEVIAGEQPLDVVVSGRFGRDTAAAR